MSVIDAENDEAAWASFTETPSDYIDPARLGDVLGANINAQLCSELRQCARLRRRLSSLIIAHYKLPPLNKEMPDGPDKQVAVIPTSELPALALRAGAIYWSTTLAGVVKRDDVARIQKIIGEGLFRFAIRHNRFGGPKRRLEPFETLQRRMSADGWCCYIAWCEDFSPGIAARARLKVPPKRLHTQLSEQIKIKGSEILRQAINYRGA